MSSLSYESQRSNLKRSRDVSRNKVSNRGLQGTAPCPSLLRWEQGVYVSERCLVFEGRNFRSSVWSYRTSGRTESLWLCKGIVIFPKRRIVRHGNCKRTLPLPTLSTYWVSWSYTFLPQPFSKETNNIHFSMTEVEGYDRCVWRCTKTRPRLEDPPWSTYKTLVGKV